MKEPIKTKFTWDDLEDKYTFIPCKYCIALDDFPTCDDGATSAACNHCAYNITDYCLHHDV